MGRNFDRPLFIKILSLFNTQPDRPRASRAISKHVGRVPYSRGFKFGEKRADQNFAKFWPTGPALGFHPNLKPLESGDPPYMLRNCGRGPRPIRLCVEKTKILMKSDSAGPVGQNGAKF